MLCRLAARRRQAHARRRFLTKMLSRSSFLLLSSRASPVPSFSSVTNTMLERISGGSCSKSIAPTITRLTHQLPVRVTKHSPTLLAVDDLFCF